ncbi:MAG: SGNH/GDSL hydrolase family protein [Chitinophagales bacterium]
MENYRYVYFSPYKTKEQYTLLKFFRPKTTVLPLTEAYLPNSKNTIKKSEFVYAHHYNKDGFRDQKCISDADTNFYNIVFLGDSFIEGEGAPNDSTLPVLLQNKLTTSKSFHNKQIKVYNCGISGSNPLSEIELYKNKIAEQSINMVVLCVFENDLGDMDVTLQQNKPLPVKEYFFAISHIFRILSIPFGNYIELNSNSKENQEATEKIIQHLLLQLENFSVYLSNKNAELQLIYIPNYTEFEMKKTIGMFKVNTKMRDALQVKYQNIINLHDEFLKRNIKTRNDCLRYYWEKNGHFNSNGYNLAAEIIKNKLEQNKNIKSTVN